MPLAPPPVMNVAAPVKRLYPEPLMLWPSYPGYASDGGSDLHKFPPLAAIKARKSAHLPEALTAFIEAVWGAQERILVLDDFLFKPEGLNRQARYEQILFWLTDGLVANEIKFLTNRHEDLSEQELIQRQLNERVALINQRAPRRVGLATVEVRFSLGSKFPHVHDRFAIIDNELWHFGATVGGLHSLVNAATRGWDAEACEAIRFFNEAWTGDGDF